MHYQLDEKTAVAQLVSALLAKLKKASIHRVKAVRIRRGTPFSEALLRAEFTRIVDNTPLQGAVIVMDDFTCNFTCKTCGVSHFITGDNLFDLLFICPDCGWSHEIENAGMLELVDVMPCLDTQDDGPA